MAHVLEDIGGGFAVGPETGISLFLL